MVGHIVHKFQFFINMRIGQFRAESMTLYSCLKSCKKYDLIIFACAISCKKYLFRINAQFLANLVSYWYKIDAKFNEKSHFMQKHEIRKRIYCFVKPLIGRAKSTESLILVKRMFQPSTDLYFWKYFTNGTPLKKEFL